MRKNSKPDLAELGLPRVCRNGPECAQALGVGVRSFWRWLQTDADLASIVKVRREFSDVRVGVRRLIEADTFELLRWKENRAKTYRSSLRKKAKAS
jgi:hypothetical protein